MKSGWKYYISTWYTTSEEAVDIHVPEDDPYFNQNCVQSVAECAADDFYAKNSSDIDMGEKLMFVIISPEGIEHFRLVVYEQRITHYVYEVGGEE